MNRAERKRQKEREERYDGEAKLGTLTFPDGSVVQCLPPEGRFERRYPDRRVELGGGGVEPTLRG